MTHWHEFSRLWKWGVGVSSGIAAIIGAFFALQGAIQWLDDLVITEVEAAELAKAQIQVLQQLSADIASERRQREIEDTVIELRRIDDVISRLNGLSSLTPDQTEQRELLRMDRSRLRARLRYLRCVDDGRAEAECR